MYEVGERFNKNILFFILSYLRFLPLTYFLIFTTFIILLIKDNNLAEAFVTKILMPSVKKQAPDAHINFSHLRFVLIQWWLISATFLHFAFKVIKLNIPEKIWNTFWFVLMFALSAIAITRSNYDVQTILTLLIPALACLRLYRIFSQRYDKFKARYS